MSQHHKTALIQLSHLGNIRNRIPCMSVSFLNVRFLDGNRSCQAASSHMLIISIMLQLEMLCNVTDLEKCLLRSFGKLKFLNPQMSHSLKNESMWGSEWDSERERNPTNVSAGTVQASKSYVVFTSVSPVDAIINEVQSQAVGPGYLVLNDNASVSAVHSNATDVRDVSPVWPVQIAGKTDNTQNPLQSQSKIKLITEKYDNILPVIASFHWL